MLVRRTRLPKSTVGIQDNEVLSGIIQDNWVYVILIQANEVIVGYHSR
jgi:hypothetical protein